MAKNAGPDPSLSAVTRRAKRMTGLLRKGSGMWKLTLHP